MTDKTINEVLTRLDSLTDFMTQQGTDYYHQLIDYTIVNSWMIIAVITTAVVTLWITFIVLRSKAAWKEEPLGPYGTYEKCAANPAATYSIVVGIVAVACTVIAIVVTALEATKLIKCKIAPKVFCVEHTIKKLKE